MIDNTLTVVFKASNNFSFAGWAAIVIAALALITTIYFSTKNINLTKLVTLIDVIAKELSTDEARNDRKLIREIKKQPLEEMRKLVVWGIDKNNTYREAEFGRAIERTISRLDRLSFFLLGHGHKPLIEPPIWFWTHVNDAWEKLGDWVEYRQTKKEDMEFYHQNYGFYLQRMENYRSKHKL